MNEIIRLYNLFGSLICHQLPSRTIFLDGVPLPVCARDTGIYLGIFTGTIYILVRGRFRSDKPPGVASAVVLCLAMLPMIVDGMGSYLGLFSSNNVQRLFTGAYFGLSIPFFLIPSANFKVYSRNTRPVLKSPSELIWVFVPVAVVCLMLERGMLPYLPVSTVIVASLIFLLGRLSFTLVKRALPAAKHAMLATAGATFCMLAFLYLVSVFILQPLKTVFLK